MIKKIAILLIGLFLYSIATADSWHFEKKSSNKIFNFNSTKIILTTDATRNQQYPDFILKIFNKNELMSKYKNIAFQDLYAYLDNTMFIGISNNGLPGTAIVIFDDKGNLILEIKHAPNRFKYCSYSITTTRIWYRREGPKFKIRYNNENKLEDITYLDCNNQRTSFIKTIDNIYSKTLIEDAD